MYSSLSRVDHHFFTSLRQSSASRPSHNSRISDRSTLKLRQSLLSAPQRKGTPLTKSTKFSTKREKPPKIEAKKEPHHSIETDERELQSLSDSISTLTLDSYLNSYFEKRLNKASVVDKNSKKTFKSPKKTSQRGASSANITKSSATTTKEDTDTPISSSNRSSPITDSSNSKTKAEKELVMGYEPIDYHELSYEDKGRFKELAESLIVEGKKDLLLELIRFGLPYDAYIRFNCTPFQLAVYYNQVEIMQALIEHNWVDFDQLERSRGYQAIHIAYLRSSKQALEFLVSQGMGDLNSLTKYGKNPAELCQEYEVTDMDYYLNPENLEKIKGSFLPIK